MNDSSQLLCDVSQSCLVLIDIQEKLVDAIPNKVGMRMQRNATFLVQAAKALSLPILVTTQYQKGLGPLIENLEQLLPEQASRVEKNCFSATANPEFLSKLEETGRKQVIVVGMEAHVCILQTAIELSRKPYEVFVVSDAICSRFRENYENALLRMRQAGICCVETESVLFEWLRDAQHPLFKELIQMIK